MEQFIKELKEIISSKKGGSALLILLAKVVIFILAKRNVKGMSTLSKFMSFSENTMENQGQSTQKSNEQTLKELRRKNGKNHSIRFFIVMSCILLGLYSGEVALHWYQSRDSFLLQIFDKRSHLAFFSIACFILAMCVRLKRYRCPMCYCEEGTILDSEHTGSTSHYDNFYYKNYGWTSNKVGTTDYYNKTIKCSCCGHISVYKHSTFSRR